MKKNFLALTIAASVLAACGSGDAPEGQVAATVNGEEITVADLNMEMGGATSKDPEQLKKMREAALQSIVNRTILAEAATNEAGVGDTPAAAMVQKKAQQMALIQLLQQQAQTNVPQPSTSEARQFISENPDAFANRRIFTVDQLVVQSVTPEVLNQMEPLDTLDQIKKLLDDNNLPYASSIGTVDSLAIPSAATKQINELKMGDVFVVPGNGGVRVNRLRAAEASPISGPAAEKLAQNLLMRQRITKQVNDRFETYLTAGRANVKYNKEFEPAEKPGAAPANTPAKPAGPAPATGE